MIKKLFHKWCYRIYINGYYYSKKINGEKIQGVNKTSVLSNLELGSNVTFGGEVMLMGAGKIVIGDETMVGAGTIIHSSTHNYKNQPMNSERIDLETRIGNNVWIGAGAIINPGIVIANNVVIGSGSVVTKNVEEGHIVAGSPAKTIKIVESNIQK
jgi:maltose O-acetyltransferase